MTTITLTAARKTVGHYALGIGLGLFVWLALATGLVWALAYPAASGATGAFTPAAVPVPTPQSVKSSPAAVTPAPVLPAGQPLPQPVAVPTPPWPIPTAGPEGEGAIRRPVAVSGSGNVIAAAGRHEWEAGITRGPGIFLVTGTAMALIALLARARQRRVSRIHGLSLLAVLLAGCGAGGPIPTQAPQLPGDYLINALDWVEANYVKGDAVDWASLRRQAMALAPDPQTTAEAHPALQYVTEQLGDGVTFFLSPDERKQQGDYGLSALYPDAVILGVDPGGPAERAGLRAGDQIETVSGAPPRAWHATQFLDFGNDAAISLTVLRAGEPQPISVTLQKTTANRQSAPTGRRFTLGHTSIGYIELPVESGAGQRYPTLAQKVLREADQAAACGWIVDVRRNAGGDIWSYLAAIGPILGEGDAGGFVYRDGTREPWTYRDGKVFWNGNERDESLVEGPVYRPKRAAPPVALLTSRDTDAAGELLVVAFRGRPQVRSFGEPTGGAPFLSFHTDLSDGAFLAVSGAYAVDRTGRTYDGPIPPDEIVATDWTRLGTEQDPVVQAALTWLQGQSGCAL